MEVGCRYPNDLSNSPPPKEGTLRLKSCIRCGGDVVTRTDMYGKYSDCLQCGSVIDIERENNGRDEYSRSGRRVRQD